MGRYHFSYQQYTPLLPPPIYTTHHICTIIFPSLSCLPLKLIKLLENIIFVQTSGHNALAPKHWTHKYSAHLFNSALPPNNERLQPYSGIQEQVSERKQTPHHFLPGQMGHIWSANILPFEKLFQLQFIPQPTWRYS